MKQPLKCEFIQDRKKARREGEIAKAKFENPSAQEFAEILAKKVAPKHQVRRTPVICPEVVRALEEMKKHQDDVQFTLEHCGVLYKFLRGTWENQYRIDTNYVVSSERKTYRIDPNESLHIQYLMDGLSLIHI